MLTKPEELKKRIMRIVLRSGLPVSRQNLGEWIVLPQNLHLNDLLGELITERRLIIGYTLSNNGEADYTYNIT